MIPFYVVEQLFSTSYKRMFSINDDQDYAGAVYTNCDENSVKQNVY